MINKRRENHSFHGFARRLVFVFHIVRAGMKRAGQATDQKLAGYATFIERFGKSGLTSRSFFGGLKSAWEQQCLHQSVTINTACGAGGPHRLLPLAPAVKLNPKK
jgi:hypothetical protein